MSDSPFADVRSPLLFGMPLEHFACAYCGEAATNSVALMLKEGATDEKPSIILSYFICARCGALHWEAAGEKVMASLRESFKE